MGWLIEALANVFLELLGDMMSWTVNLITGLSLDIGMNSVTKEDGTVVTEVPDIGTLINPAAPRTNLLESTFPDAASFTTLFMILGASIIMFLFLTKIFAGFGGPFVKAEPGGVVVVRTFIASLLTAYSYSIFVLLESLFNSIYGQFMTKYTSLTAGVDNYSLNPDNSVSGPTDNSHINQYMTGGGADDAFKMFGKDLIEDYQWGQGLALTIITIVLFTILLVSFLKLVLEIFERYVMIGVLFFMAPIACATYVDREMDVFKNWVKMTLSEFVVMCSNLFFTGVFISAWHTVLSTEEHALFQTPKDFVTTMFLMIAWLIIGQQFDAHLKSMGFATAQTGRGLGASVVAGFGAATMAARSAIHGAKNIASSGISAARRTQAASPDHQAAQFLRSNETRTLSPDQANAALNRMQSGSDAAFNNMSPIQQGEKMLKAANDSSKGAVAEAIRDQTGSGLDFVSRASVKMKDGLMTGETLDGKPFALHSRNHGTSDYVQRDIGNGWGVPLTSEGAQAYATMQGAKTPTITGQQGKWTPIDTPSADSKPYTTLAAADKDGNILMTMSTPGIIDGGSFYEHPGISDSGFEKVETASAADYSSSSDAQSYEQGNAGVIDSPGRLLE